MKVLMFVLFLVLVGSSVVGQDIAATPERIESSGIAEGKLPTGYRDWKLVTVSREQGKLDDIRAILGNDIAIDAMRKGTRPFPDGSIVARLAWACEPSEENNKAFGNIQSYVAGEPKNGVQFMVKDSLLYAETGGWRYFQFDGGKPLNDQSKLQSCFECHQAIKPRDYVFSHYSQ